MKNTTELLAELNSLRASMKRISDFKSVSDFMDYNKEYAIQHANILSQIESACNPGLTKDQIILNHKKDWKENGKRKAA